MRKTLFSHPHRSWGARLFYGKGWIPAGARMAALVIFLLSVPALADENYLTKYLGGSPVQVGEAEYYKLIIDVYTGLLYTASGQFDETKPFALELKYKISADGDDIADASLDQMQNIEKLDEKTTDDYSKKMNAVFPDVKNGDSVTGIYLPGKAVFFKNGERIGEIDDAQFAKRFFAIWISPKTSDKSFRKKLLNLS